MKRTSEMTGHHIIPLFPLGVVLLPQMELPLHIFEERYKVMINECLEQEREFGVVHYDGTDIRSIGCTAKILGVVKHYEDGRMDIVTRGKPVLPSKTWTKAESICKLKSYFLKMSEKRRPTMTRHWPKK